MTEHDEDLVRFGELHDLIKEKERVELLVIRRRMWAQLVIIFFVWIATMIVLGSILYKGH